jgi:hypothetical protein
MKSKSYDTSSSSEGYDKDYQNARNVLSKFDYDLFDEEQDLVEKVFHVRRTLSPNKGEKWKIFCDNKVIFVVDSLKISKKEKEFLRAPDGFNFLIAQAKNGIKSLNQLRVELKKTFKK